MIVGSGVTVGSGVIVAVGFLIIMVAFLIIVGVILIRVEVGVLSAEGVDVTVGLGVEVLEIVWVIVGDRLGVGVSI